MAFNYTDKNKTGTQKNKEKIDSVHCPENMSLTEWQRRLRRAAGEKENLPVGTPEAGSPVFIVHNPKSGRKYQVDYYGEGSAYNRCECMDFRTSGLGTCKHLEKVRIEYGGRIVMPGDIRPGIYVDYTDGRRIKIRYGADPTGEIRRLAAGYFDSRRSLRDIALDPTKLIKGLKVIDERFEIEDDALGLIIEARDRKRRKAILKEKYEGATFDGLLKTALHPYQADGVRFAFAGGRTINADEMGLGKTVQAIATAELLKREGFIDSVLIICPTSLKYQWLSEIKRFTDSTAIVIEGNLLKRRDFLADSRYFYKIGSFHSLSNSIKAGDIPEVDMVIYDELQRLKNRDTQTGKQLRKLHSHYVLALSGTPLENKLEELYSVTQLVDQYLLSPLYQFVDETTIRDENGKIVGYKNLHSIAERLRGTLIRRKKSEVQLQMPMRTDTNLFVPMTKEQAAIHDEYKNMVAQLIFKWRRWKFLNEKDRKRLLLMLSMMRMVCDSTYILDQKTRHDTKIEEIMAIIGNLLANDEGKVVIFSQWERMLRILSKELDENDIDYCFLHGGVPSAKRKDLIDRFRDDSGCRVFLSTDAGATGLNLQTASLLINVDLPWNPAVLEQRIARIYRLGQKNPVQIINMIARGTIEERMLATLRFKSNLAAGILDGGDDAVFLENKKFEQIVEIVDSVLDDSPRNKESAPVSPNKPIEINGSIPDFDNEPNETSKIASDTLSTDSHTGVKPDNVNPGAPAKEGAVPSAEKMRDMVAEGMSIIGTLANALRNPESTRVLADALVREDPATGKAYINIPVQDKSTVVNMLSAFASLLGGMKK